MPAKVNTLIYRQLKFKQTCGWLNLALTLYTLENGSECDLMFILQRFLNQGRPGTQRTNFTKNWLLILM